MSKWEAGAALDAEIEKRVFGREVCGGTLSYPKTYRPLLTCSACLAATGDPRRHEGEIHRPAPAYSTDWAAAGQIVDALYTGRGLSLRLEQNRIGEYVAMFAHHGDGALRSSRPPAGYAVAKTVPEAISLAGLFAVVNGGGE